MIEFPASYLQLIAKVTAQLRTDPDGEHGLPHWRRVYRNGLLIAKADPRVDMEVVALYAILHDSQREPSDEARDKMHGVLASRYAQELADKGWLKWLTKAQLTQLRAACIDHVLQLTVDLVSPGAATLAACFDADRLDWPRFGFNPEPKHLRSLYCLQPGVVERHIEEAWNPDDPNAMIEVD